MTMKRLLNLVLTALFLALVTATNVLARPIKIPPPPIPDPLSLVWTVCVGVWSAVR